MKSIARRGIADRISIARRQIATAGGQVSNQQPFYYPPAPSAYNFTPPTGGHWKFVLWGMGGTNNSIGNASGAYIEVTRELSTAQTAVINVPQFSVNASDASVTFPDGTSAIAGNASGATPGVATGGDVNLNGTAGTAGGTSSDGGHGLGTGGGVGGIHASTNDGGAGAPANLPFRGGAGGVGGSAPPPGPGGGIGQASGAGASCYGQALVIYLGP